jgi:hypothetical protein
MKYKYVHTIATVLFLNCFGPVSIAQTQNPSKDNNWINISNGPKCAVDMKQPADSIFISATLRNTGIMLNNLAKQAGYDPASFVGDGLKFYKIKINILSKSIIDGLNSGQLDFITKEVDAATQWKKLNENKAEKKYFNSASCSQVNEINSFYSHLFLRGTNKETLTQLAEKLSDSKSQLNCETENIKNDLDLYPVYNYDLKISTIKNWQNVGFDFWSSFKIYLSYAWRHSQNSLIRNHPMNKISMLIPMEEQVLLLPNGCKSIERPECKSDFLSSAELRTLLTTDRSKLEMTGSSLEMKDLIMDNNDQVDASSMQNLAKKSGDQAWIKDFQKSYLGFSSKQIQNLYTANKLFSSLSTQKSNSERSRDLINEMKLSENFEEAYYLCSEHRLLNQEQPLNVYKLDLDYLKANGSKLDQFLKYGMTVSDMLTTFSANSDRVTEMCNELDKNQKRSSEQKWNNYRPWYISFLSRYQIIKAAIDVEKEEGKENPTEFVDQRPMTYLKDQCASSIDCHRKMIESVVQLNKLLIHSKIFMRTEVQAVPLFNERAEKVACGTYDPFEVSRLNKKNLIAGSLSAIAFGFTSLPIYLDFQYKPKELVSFNKLLEDGQIKFDPEFSKDQVKKTVSFSLGSFMNVPCSINISQTDVNLSDVNASYIFKGLGVNACQGHKSQSLESPTGSIDVFKKNQKSDLQVCGQCVLNFEKISLLESMKSFWVLRPFIIISEKLAKYQAIKNDETINPHEFNISTKSLLDTYIKNNKSIPEKCVSMLSRGLSCQSNICEALAVKEFEIKSGLNVESIELGQNERQMNSYNSAWIKVKGCKKELKMIFQCSGNGNSFWMPVSEREYKQCKE